MSYVVIFVLALVLFGLVSWFFTVYNGSIQVDGGIKLHNANEVISAGGDILVAGSEVFGSKNPQKVIKDFYANAKSAVSI